MSTDSKGYGGESGQIVHLKLLVIGLSIYESVFYQV